jgi:hypothetical protein
MHDVEHENKNKKRSDIMHAHEHTNTHVADARHRASCMWNRHRKPTATHIHTTIQSTSGLVNHVSLVHALMYVNGVHERACALHIAAKEVCACRSAHSIQHSFTVILYYWISGQPVMMMLGVS